MKQRIRNESSVERSFTRALARLSLISWKLHGPGSRGKPDRVILLPSGKVLFIEFKREGGIVRPLQAHVHRELRELGYAVGVFDDADDAIAWVRKWYDLMSNN